MLTLQGGDSLVGGLPIIHITYQQYIANPSAYHDPDVIVHISGFPTAGNLPADYVGYDSNMNMEDIGNIATKAIAKVEPSDTALYLHNVGDGFINKDGDYCLTDVQIAVGGTIALGTNCHVVDGGISSNLTNIKIVELFSGSLSYTNGISEIAMPYLFNGTKIPILAYVEHQTAPAFISSNSISIGYGAVTVVLPFSTAFTGTLTTHIYGISLIG